MWGLRTIYANLEFRSTVIQNERSPDPKKIRGKNIDYYATKIFS
jgi:hypothetical protein